jgi:hypothetical protein
VVTAVREREREREREVYMQKMIKVTSDEFLLRSHIDYIIRCLWGVRLAGANVL